MPLQRTLGGGGERNCVESINQAAMVFNSKLSSSIEALNKSLPKARLVYLDNYSELNETIQHYNKFGKFLHLLFICHATLAKFHDNLLTLMEQDLKWGTLHAVALEILKQAFCVILCP